MHPAWDYYWEGISKSTGVKGVKTMKHWRDKKIRLGFVPCLTASVNLKEHQQKRPLNVWGAMTSQVLPWWQFPCLPTVTSQPHRSGDSHNVTFSLLPIFLEKQNSTAVFKIQTIQMKLILFAWEHAQHPKASTFQDLVHISLTSSKL